MNIDRYSKKRLLIILGLLSLPLLAYAQGSGTALTCNGTTYASGGNVDFGLTGTVTVMSWVKWNITPSSGNKWANIATSNATTGNGDQGQFWLQHAEFNSAFEFAVMTGSGRAYIQGTTAPQNGVWYHVAGVYTGSAIQIYVNGVLEGSTSWSGTIPALTPVDQFSVGRWSNAGNAYRILTGDLDEISVWSSALSQTDIRDNMCKKLAGSEIGLCGYWRFDEGSGGTATDLSGNGKTLTLSAPATQWTCSSAPVGDVSTSLYTTSWSGLTITLAHPAGDYVIVSDVTNSPVGLHLILVDEAPNATSSNLYAVSTKRYWIIYVIGGSSPTWRTRYYYMNAGDQGHPGIGNESRLRLAARSDNCVASWTEVGNNPTPGSNYIQLNSITATYRPQLQLILGTNDSSNPLTDDTYRWIGGNGSWATAINWQPTRSTLRTSDVLIFDNFNAGPVTVSNIPTQTVSRIEVNNDAVVTWQAASAVTLTMIDELNLEAGSSLAMNGTSAITMQFGSRASGLIGGTMSMLGGAAHRLNATDAQAVRFESGAMFVQEAPGPVFGNTGTPNAVVFGSGSSFAMQSALPAAVPPFGLAAPSSKVLFESGSTYVLHSTVAGVLPMSNRSYANVLVDANTAHLIGTAFSGNASIDTLTITNGSSLTIDHAAGTGNGTIMLAGDLIVDGSLVFGSAASVNYTLMFTGTSPQKIRGAGSITLPANLAGVITSSTGGVALARDLSVDCLFSVTNGQFAIEGHTLQLNGALNVAAPNGLLGGMTSRLVFGGSGASTNLSGIELLDLVIDRSSGIAMIGDVLVDGELTLTSGALSIGANELTIAGRIQATSGTLTGGTLSGLEFTGTMVSPLPSVEVGTLTMAKSGGVTLTGDVTVHSGLVLTNGVIAVADQAFIFSESATVTGTPSASAMVAITGAGSVRRRMSSANTFTFPIGDMDGSADYSPLTANVLSGSFAPGAFLRVRVTDVQHPQDSGTTVGLTRYWTLSESGITNYTIDVQATYVQSDVLGGEHRLHAARWDGIVWSSGIATDTVTNTLTFSGLVALGDFTGKDETPYLVISQVNGAWQDLSTWDAGRVPLDNDSVIVRHVVDFAGVETCQGLFIEGTGTLRHASSGSTLVINGGWTNDGILDAGTYITVYFAGRPGLTYGVDGTTTTVFWGLTVAGPSALRSDIAVTGELGIDVGGILYGQDRDIELRAAGSPLRIMGTFEPDMSRVRYAADDVQTITSTEYYNLVVSAPGAVIRNRTLAGDIVVRNTLTLGPSSSLNAASWRIDLQGSDPVEQLGGIFDAGASTVAYSGAIDQNIAALTYYNLHVSTGGVILPTPVVKTASGDIRAYGTVTVDTLALLAMGSRLLEVAGDVLQRGNESGGAANQAGHLTWGIGGTLSFFGSGNSVFYGNHTLSDPDVVNLQISKTGVEDTVRIASTAAGTPRIMLGPDATINVLSGVLDYGDANVTATQALSSLFSIASLAVVRASGQSNFPVNGSGFTYGFTTATLQSGSSVELYGSNQDVPGSDHGITSYGILKLLGDGTKTMTDDFFIADSLILTSPVIFDDNGAVLLYGVASVLRYNMAGDSIPAWQTSQNTGDELPTASSPRLVVLDNPKDVRLTASRSIAGGVDFLRGKMILGSNTLTLGSSAVITGNDALRFFLTDGSGSLKRGNVGAGQTEFPVGTITGASLTDTTYTPLLMSNSGTPDNFAVRVQSAIDNPPMFLTDVVNLQWSVSEDTPGGSNATMSFQWNASDQAGSFNPSGSVVVNYFTTTWNEQAAMVAGSDPYTATALVPEISKYFVALASPLPVELLTFSAIRRASLVDLQWETATELLNNGFEIQRSNDGSVWRTRGWVEGAGTSYSPKRYSWTDTLAADGLFGDAVYYRLLQIDADGSEQPSPILMVALDAPPSRASVVGNYPQPFTDGTTIRLSIPAEQAITLEVYDTVGRLVHRIYDGVTMSAGTHAVMFSSVKLRAGAYLCVLRAGAVVETLLLIKR